MSHICWDVSKGASRNSLRGGQTTRGLGAAGGHKELTDFVIDSGQFIYLLFLRVMLNLWKKSGGGGYGPPIP